MLKIRNRKSLVAYLAAYFVPIIIFLAAFLMLPIFKIPRSILYQDPNVEFTDFLAYFRRLLRGEESFFYSFNLSSGSSMIPVISFYLFSPLNALVLFVPNHMIGYVFFAIVLIKIGFIGLTGYYYFRKEHKKLGVWRPLIFAWGLALSAYLLGYFEHFEWLDSIILLPVVCLGINKIVRGEKPWLYLAALTGAVLTCYYSGFMICIFSVIWLIYRLIVDGKKREEIKKATGTFIKSSLLAGLISTFLLLPTALAMAGSNTGRFNPGLFTPGSRYALKQIILQFTGNQVYYQPLIFAGMVVTILMLFYFVNSKISIKEKLAGASVLAFLIASTNIKGLSAIWHLGTLERGAPYRFTFIISFFMAILAARALEEYADFKKKKAIAIIAIVFSVIYLIMIPDGFSAVRNSILYLDLAIIALAVAVLSRGSKSTGKILVGSQFCSLAFFTLSMLVVLGRWEIGVSSFKTTENAIKEITEIIDKVKAQDSSAEFYRIEKTFSRSENDGLQAGYHGTSSYTSTTYPTIVVGAAMSNYVYDNANFGEVTIGDMMPNIAASAIDAKYIITTNGNYMDPKYYTLVAQTEKYSAYSYNMALPLAMVLDNELVESEDFFDYDRENNVSEYYLGEKIFTNVKADMELENLVEYDGVFKKVVSPRDGVITYRIKNPEHQTIFARLDMGKMGSHVIDDSEVLLKGADGEYKHIGNLGSYTLFNLGEDEEIEVRIKVFQDEIELKEQRFFYEDNEVTERLVHRIKSQKSEWTEVSNTELSGKVSVKKPNQKLLFALEYDKSWQITVDGEPVEMQRAMKDVFAIDVAEGEHEIRLKYVPRGWYAGVAMSAIGVATAVVWYLVDRKKSKK